jgi:toxin ParE1/3/4
MKLRYERGALADLEEIFAYIAADNPEAASRLVARIEEVATKIAASPYMGEATRKSAFRRFPVGNYLIVYEVGAPRGRHSLRAPRRAPAAVGGRGIATRP